MNPDETGLKGSGFIWWGIQATKVHKQMREQTAVFVNIKIGLNTSSNKKYQIKICNWSMSINFLLGNF